MKCDCEIPGQHNPLKSIHSSTLESFEDTGDIYQCSKCQSFWISVMYENAAFTKSMHWYRALLPKNFDLKSFIESTDFINDLFLASPLCFRGGGFFNGIIEEHVGVPKRLV